MRQGNSVSGNSVSGNSVSGNLNGAAKKTKKFKALARV